MISKNETLIVEPLSKTPIDRKKRIEEKKLITKKEL